MDAETYEMIQNLAQRIARLESRESIAVAQAIPTYTVENKPAPGVQGRLIFLTNAARVAHDDGIAWHYVSGGGLVP